MICPDALKKNAHRDGLHRRTHPGRGHHSKARSTWSRFPAGEPSR